MPASATLSGNALARPALHLLEGRTGDANQVAVVLAAEIRFEIAAVGLDIDHCLAFPDQAQGRAASAPDRRARSASTPARPPTRGRRWRPPPRRRRAPPSCGAPGLRPCRRSPRTVPTASRRRCWCRSRAAASSRRCAAASRPAETAPRRTAVGPGQITPPRYSPFADTASNVVAVPKSTTMIGRPLP